MNGAVRYERTIVADKTRIQQGDTVTFRVEPTDRNRYEFNFGDGTERQIKERNQSEITHRFDVADDHTVSATAMNQPGISVQPVVITVQSLNTPTPITKVSQDSDWPWYLILILILVVLILLAGIYKIVSHAITPKPSFVAQTDLGTASMDQTGVARLIEFELHLDPNVREGDFDILHGERSLIRAERSQ